jgi:3-hydroxyacyl-CoA dehydrogenase
MGEGIAQGFAMGGMRVRLLDVDQGAAQAAVDRMARSLQLFSELDLLADPPEQVQARVEPSSMTGFPEAVYDCEFIVEAVPEVLEVKQAVFEKLDSCPPDSVLSSNTSSLTISAIAEGMRTAERVVGLHYFMPADVIPLVEVHRGVSTDDSAVELARQLMCRIGKQPVVVRKEIPGFIVNRLQAAMGRECDHLIDQGVTTPEELDLAVVYSFGLRLAHIGPIMMTDIQGLDTICRAKSGIHKSLCCSTEVSPDLKAKVDRGETGLKAGKGYYDWHGIASSDVTAQLHDVLLRQMALLRATREAGPWSEVSASSSIGIGGRAGPV